MLKHKKAEMGIGTLIIFIAMILVAAIAAGVLIQTQSSLQSKALLTGEKSKNQIATSLQTLSLAAEDGSTGNNVDTFYQTLKLAPGSEEIRLSDALLIFDTNNDSASYSYDSSADCSNVPAASTGHYAVRYLIGGDNPGYISRGDVVQVCYKSSRAIGESEAVRITFMPKIGTPMVLETSMPEIITKQRTQIYPGS